MMRRIAVVAVVLLSGCGGCGEQLPQDELCANVSQGLWNQITASEVSCGEELSEADLLRLSNTTGDYTSFKRALSCDVDGGPLGLALQKVQSSVSAGKMGYDGKKALECRQRGRAARDGGAGMTEEDEALCLSVLTGTVAIGGACAHHDECGLDAYCRPSGNESCAGTCVARVAPGVACDPDLDVCAQPARCQKSANAPAWVCTSPGAVGATCSNNLPCGEGLGCFNGRCVARQDAGVACKDVEGGGDCYEGLECLLRMGGPGMETVGECSPPAKLDESCGTPDRGRASCGPCLACKNARCVARAAASACESDLDCPVRYLCGPAKTCVLRPRDGEPCVVDPLPEEFTSIGNCLFDDTFCNRPGAAMPGVCALIPSVGQPCGNRHDLAPICTTGYCRGTATDGGVCADLPVAGEVCGLSAGLSPACATGHYCQRAPTANQGICVVATPGGEGDPCGDSGCARGLFCQADAGLTCRALRPAGNACGAGSECASTRCSEATKTCVQPCNQYQNLGGCLSCAGGTRELGLFLFFAAALIPLAARRRRS
jgi:hypothetical protein